MGDFYAHDHSSRGEELHESRYDRILISSWLFSAVRNDSNQDSIEVGRPTIVRDRQVWFTISAQYIGLSKTISIIQCGSSAHFLVLKFQVTVHVSLLWYLNASMSPCGHATVTPRFSIIMLVQCGTSAPLVTPSYLSSSLPSPE